jgi:hypothetical protein
VSMPCYGNKQPHPAAFRDLKGPKHEIFVYGLWLGSYIFNFLSAKLFERRRRNRLNFLAVSMTALKILNADFQAKTTNVLNFLA